jgi:hypothetical protein
MSLLVLSQRTVVVIGIPFPNARDQRVILKKEYLSQQPGGNGQTWYTQQALRAVNQAIGRVVRHKDDHGSIILMDERFKKFTKVIYIFIFITSKDLPKWVQPSVEIFEGFGTLQRALALFFKDKRGSEPSSVLTSIDSMPVNSTSSYSIMPQQSSLGIRQQMSQAFNPIASRVYKSLSIVIEFFKHEPCINNLFDDPAAYCQEAVAFSTCLKTCVEKAHLVRCIGK